MNEYWTWTKINNVPFVWKCARNPYEIFYSNPNLTLSVLKGHWKKHNISLSNFGHFNIQWSEIENSTAGFLQPKCNKRCSKIHKKYFERLFDRSLLFEVFISKVVFFPEWDLQEQITVFLSKTDSRYFFSDILFSLYWQNYIVFDSQVAGGLSTGLSVRETVIKETNEEANLPKHIATQMKPAGCVRYLLTY